VNFLYSRFVGKIVDQPPRHKIVSDDQTLRELIGLRPIEERPHVRVFIMNSRPYPALRVCAGSELVRVLGA
jgi:hypothetical protein